MTRRAKDLFDCDRVGSYLESYLLGQVPPPERRGMRLHIHSCPACFEKVTSRDPLQLFAPLADETRPDEAWDGFFDAIRDGIREERRPIPMRFRPGRRAAFAAMAAAAALALVAVLWMRAPVDTPPQVTAAPPLSGSEAPHGGGVPLPQTVEEVLTADAREVQVFTMTYEPWMAPPPAGGPPPVAALVLIVDSGLEL